MMHLFRLVFCLLLVNSTAYFQLHAQSVRERIETAFLQFSTDEALRNASYSLTVLDGETGEQLFASQPHLGLAPASTLKVLTAISGYSLLGPDYTFTTQLGYSGRVDQDGVLQGDLILQGSGDPSLGSDRFSATRPEALLNRWQKAVKAKGIKSVAGRVIADDALFQGYRAPDGWPWGDLGNYFGAGVSSLNWRENFIALSFKSGRRAAEPVQLIKAEPELPYLEMVNELVTGSPGSGDKVMAYSAPYSSKIFLRGSYAQDLNKKILISTPDPAQDLAYSLKRKLQEAGVRVAGAAVSGYSLVSRGESVPQMAKSLDSYRSPSFSELSAAFTKKSINLYGEAFLKRIALSQTGAVESAQGIAWLQQYWSGRAGIAVGELKLRDGSGLSPENRVTTWALARLLSVARGQPWYPLFYDNLPLYNGMTMKSGTIGGVLGYAGYHTSGSGQSFVFCFLVNNYHGSAPYMRQKMFKVLDSLK